MSVPNEQLPNWLHWLESCPSTNTWAIANIAKLNHGDGVFTPRQTAGRGQRGHRWHSPPGVLTVSFVLHHIPTEQLPKLSLAAGLAMIYAIEDLLPALQGALGLKWCNDVFWQGRKLAGILCEASSRHAMGQVVVGIGLNCRVDFEQAGLGASAVGRAVSLHQISAIVPDELAVLERSRRYLLQAASFLHSETHSNNPRFLALLPALRRRDVLLGRSITVEVNGEQVRGAAAGFSDCGHLLLRLPNGNVRSFVSGHLAIDTTAW